MKSVWISGFLFIAVIIFVSVHAIIITDITKDITALSDTVSKSVYEQKWETAEDAFSKIEGRWQKAGLWAQITLNAKSADEIEVSLKRSKAYLEARDDSAFLEEFSEFRVLIDDLPDNEGIGFIK